MITFSLLTPVEIACVQRWATSVYDSMSVRQKPKMSKKTKMAETKIVKLVHGPSWCIRSKLGLGLGDQVAGMSYALSWVPRLVIYSFWYVSHAHCLCCVVVRTCTSVCTVTEFSF